ncbi:TPA: thymidylate synthase [Serratia marcescens]|uniref:thymidylate synthase n=1 Tax=Serratia marcescens TaxID=615 RepID=UPI001153BACF|nr:thymidylate synthase [Serratia marcescens]MBH2916817.1 thymidylate synthase [Serratia marcescens]MBI6198358.1 thymidylate synthase [Serratia marcescens]QDI54224.1 thymidylate synthase [Serratia marcescens]CAI1804079.1 Thymidylate synthase [Serratia marcescens]HEJ6963313.1 thymidylate synthase [Serratia marcescens]
MALFVEADCIDDLLNDVHTAIIKDGIKNKPTKGANVEILGALLVLNDPIKRISRTESRSKIISCLGEFLWYMTGKNDLDFIKHYIPNYEDYAESDGRVHGGYGPRFFNMHGVYNQLENIISLLGGKGTSRRALVQLFDAADLNKTGEDFQEYKDIPCTISLQFIIREGKLNLFVNMRSNDAFKGLPHDIFAFTMFQEFIARVLNCELGKYYHYVSSMHLYEVDLDKVSDLQSEGFMSTRAIMEEMPLVTSLNYRYQLLEVERNLRENKLFDIDSEKMDDYWKDLMRIIKIHYLFRAKDEPSILEAKNEIDKLVNKSYEIFFERKLK